MSQSALRQSLRIFDLLLTPVQVILKRILPDYAEDLLRDPEYRNTVIIPRIDAILVAQLPEAAVIPRRIRRALVGRILATLIDDILLPEAAALKDASETEAPGIMAAAAAVDLPTPLPIDIGLGVRAITVEAVTADPTKLEGQCLSMVGDGWNFSPLDGLPGFYHLTPDSDTRPSVADAWDLCADLATLPGISYAEPSIAQLNGAIESAVASENLAVAASTGFGMQDHKVEDALVEPLWSLNLTKAQALWGDHQGKGILIGHIDTGYTRHPEIFPNVDSSRGYDTWDKDGNAEDDLDPSFWDRLRTNLAIPAQPGHGTGTGSIIASPEGKQNGHSGTHGVTGTAPQATLIPIRATPTVVILPTGSQDEVAAGILMAVARGVHVISMSLGSPWGSPPLKAAVKKALDAGVIVCAAAGNVVLKETWFTDVMYPAAYPGVIAVAGCDFHRRPWRDTCRGVKKVVVTAPGTDVWNADAEKKRTGLFSHVVKYSTGTGSGTSFAVATVAGIAACWLRHWSDHFGSRQALITHLGGHPSAIPAAFLQCIRQHAATPLNIPTSEPADLPGYPTDFTADKFGVGIINAQTLMTVEPTAPAISGIAAAAADFGSSDTTAGTVLSDLAHATGSLIRDIRRALASDLGLDEADLEAYLLNHGRELLHHFATSATMRRRLSTLLASGEALQSAAAAATAGAGTAIPASISLAQQLHDVASEGASLDLR